MSKNEDKKEDEIVLKQLPVIQHELQKIGKEIKAEIKEMNIDKLVATEESRSAIKEMRAKLNAKFKLLDGQRIAIDKKAAAPIKEFDKIFKDEIGTVIIEATDKLKNKLDSVEDKMREKMQTDMETFWNELCESSKVDFVTFAQTEITIKLSDRESAIKKTLTSKMDKIVDDIQLIESDPDNSDLIMVEYKKTLNVSKAITDVRQRLADLEKEKAKKLQKVWDEILNRFRTIAMVYHPTTKVFQYNDEIYVSEEKVKIAAANKTLDALLDEFSSKIKASQSPEVVEQPEPSIGSLSAPTSTEQVNEELEEIPYAFEVTCNMPQIKSLVKFMKENSIKYKSIE